MKLYIYSNDSQKYYVEKTLSTVQYFESLGIKCYLSKKASLDLYQDESHEGSIEEADYMASVGGDGTVLKAGLLASVYQKDLLGINIGRLGFLCTINFEDLKKITLDSFTTLKKTNRTILSLDYQNKNYQALNDITILKANPGRTIELEVYINNEFLFYTRGDGLIVATPTGSTAYTYSAGGPIVKTNVKAFVLTPICPHTADSKPVVVNDEDEIEIRIKNPQSGSAIILSDGDNLGTFNDQIIIKKSKNKFVTFNKVN